MDNQKDAALWKMAKERVAFRKSLLSYLGVNIFLIVVWFFSGRGHFWPMWILIGWGAALVMQYFQIFHAQSVEQEYERLKKKS